MYHINSTEYERSFWDAMKRKNPTYNGLSQGRHRMTNSYALPSAQSKQFMAAMRNENVFRSLATIVNAPAAPYHLHLRCRGYRHLAAMVPGYLLRWCGRF